MRRHVLWAVQLLRQQLCYCWCDVTLTQRDHAYGIDNFLRIAFLVKVATGALANKAYRVMLLGITAQNQNAHVRGLGANHGQRINTTLARHGQVHHQNVQFDIAHQVDRLPSAGCLSGDTQVNMLREKLFESRSHNGVIVNNTDFDHGAALA